MLEEDFKEKKRTIQNSIKDENLILAQQKKDREAKEKAERLRYEVDEVKLLQERGKPRGYAGF